ncbi:unnamed protein product [Malus baccata var. baccata]
MSNLINLRHLNNSDAYSSGGMPPQLGRLVNLQSLSNFVNVIDAEDAQRANLKCKERLDSLVLEWSHSSDTRETESAVLDMLQPHTKLKELTIKSYAGKEISSRVAVSLFSNMVLVWLEECNNCLSLPPLGQLPHLKELYIRGMTAVESVGDEFYGECISPFPLLETLEFVDMQHWKEWLPFRLDHGSDVFPCLKTLFIKKCSILEGKLPENLNSLAKLGIVKCEELVVSIANYKQLHQLNIDRCKVLVHIAAKVEFELLESLCLSNISELISLPPSLKDIKITECHSLIYLAKFQIPQNLIRIQIGDCKSLKSLVDEEVVGSSPLSSSHICLEYLKIQECQSLMSFSLSGQLLRTLKHLEIYNCLSCFFPANLTSLTISKVQSCKPLWELEWGLHKLTCLRKLCIYGNDPDMVLFPPDLVQTETLLPKSLTRLLICGFPNLMKLSSKGFQCLMSLQTMHLSNYPQLASIPEEGLPPSLTQLLISGCHVLKERCERGKGRYWQKISHIPYIA